MEEHPQRSSEYPRYSFDIWGAASTSRRALPLRPEPPGDTAWEPPLFHVAGEEGTESNCWRRLNSGEREILLGAAVPRLVTKFRARPYSPDPGLWPLLLGSSPWTEGYSPLRPLTLDRKSLSPLPLHNHWMEVSLHARPLMHSVTLGQAAGRPWGPSSEEKEQSLIDGDDVPPPVSANSRTSLLPPRTTWKEMSKLRNKLEVKIEMSDAWSKSIKSLLIITLMVRALTGLSRLLCLHAFVSSKEKCILGQDLVFGLFFTATIKTSFLRAQLA